MCHASGLRVGVLLTLGLAAFPGVAEAQATPGCNLQGSDNVLVEGRGMLRLGDVLACPGLRYEVIPSIFINGQPAVRIVPQGGCLVGERQSVTLEGKAAQGSGDVVCLPGQ